MSTRPLQDARGAGSQTLLRHQCFQVSGLYSKESTKNVLCKVERLLKATNQELSRLCIRTRCPPHHSKKSFLLFLLRHSHPIQASQVLDQSAQVQQVNIIVFGILVRHHFVHVFLLGLQGRFTCNIQQGGIDSRLN
jgi:hypothetical protein